MVFDYAESWLNSPGATPLSLPLRTKRFNRNECRGYYAGIFPEESKREIIARNLGISERNDYAMLDESEANARVRLAWEIDFESAVHNHRVGRSTPIANIVADCFPVAQKFQSFSYGPAFAAPAGGWPWKPA